MRVESTGPHPRDAVYATHRITWRTTTSVEKALVLGLVLATIGVLASRVDVVLLALPLLISGAIGVDRRPADGARSTLRVDVVRHHGTEELSNFAYHVEIAAPVGTEFVHLRVTPQGSLVYDLFLAPQDVVTVSGSFPVVHSGRQRVVDVSYRLIGIDGAWLSPPVPTEVAMHVVDPAIVPISSMPLPHRLSALTGAHRSVRTGDGGEFRDVHAFAPGDRLRRIDWKATARRSQGMGDLYVRRTDATSDATVVLVLDSREEIGERVEQWSANSTSASGLSSMDVSREAAASLATAAIGAGDRVSLIDLAAHDGFVAAGSGKRHLDRVLRRIAVSGPSGIRIRRQRAPVVQAGAIVYLLSTFLDDDASMLARLWRAAGHRVIAVDVLPTTLVDGSAFCTRVAHRLLMAERRQRIAGVRDNGVELFRWQEDIAHASRAVALRTLARAGQRRR